MNDSSELDVSLCCEQVPPGEPHRHVQEHGSYRKTSHVWGVERTEVGKRSSLDKTHRTASPKHTQYIKVRWCPSKQEDRVEAWASSNPRATPGLCECDSHEID